MLLDRVIINNYKSYGEKNNILDIHPKITTIIGKNGSGKSNILSALELFKPHSQTNRASLKKFLNLNSSTDTEVSITFQLLFDPDEQEYYSNTDRTYFTLDNDNLWHFEGGLKTIIENDCEILSYRTYLLTLVKQSYFSRDISSSINFLTKEIDVLNNQILVNQKNFLLDNLRYLKNPDTFDKENYKEYVEKLFTKYQEYSNLIPIIYKFDDKMQLKDAFSLEDISKLKKKDINESNKFLKLFIDSFNLDTNEIELAMNKSTQPSLRQRIEDSINKKVMLESQDIFNSICIRDSYIKIYFRESLNLYAYNCELSIPLCERSDGLKWYISLYSQLKKQNLLNRKSFILIDEPGQSVHIEAQKGIKDLFEKLCKNSQILYTTHSPFMIDTEDLSKLVLTEKVASFSKIHNKVHSADLENSSKLETLSPLYQALGYSCSDNIGPSFNKVNIITEGITDYYYLLGYMYYLEIPHEQFPNIIPSISVDNIHNIASILIGWGCPFKILVDYDDGGYRQIEKFDKLLLEHEKEYFTVNGVKFTKTRPNKDTYITIEKLLTEDKYQNVAEHDKLLLAKEFYDNAKSKTLNINDTSKTNIINLLKHLNIYND